MKISEINIYPIKSLRGIALSEALIEKRGLGHDRRWMLTDPHGMFFTQREVPRLATIRVAVTNDGLQVTDGSGNTLSVPLETASQQLQNVVVWQSKVEAEVCEPAVNDWFSDVLGRECQLVRMPDNSDRHVNERFDSGGDIVSFADGYPLLLTNEASLRELNQRIKTNAGVHVRDNETSADSNVRVPMNRFRPNVVIAGAEPFAEDRWAKIRIGEAVFRVVKPCARCVTTTVDQAEGEFAGKEPLRTLATFRRGRDVYPDEYSGFGFEGNEVLFAVNLIPETPGVKIRIGEPLEVLDLR